MTVLAAIVGMVVVLVRQLGGECRLVTQGGIVMVLAAIVGVVVVLALAAVAMAATAATKIRRLRDSALRAMSMSEYRTIVSDYPTAMSEPQTMQASSLFGAILLVRRRSLTTASHGAMASPDRDPRPRVTTGLGGDQFHQDHRGPGDHPSKKTAQGDPGESAGSEVTKVVRSGGGESAIAYRRPGAGASQRR